LSRTLDVYVEHQVHPPSRGAAEFAGMRSVIVAENLGVLEEFAFSSPLFKLLTGDEKVILAVALLAARREIFPSRMARK
jgi:hypothetical protein